MHCRKKLAWLGAGLCVAVGLIGCGVTTGRSLDSLRTRAAGDPLVRGPDIPLVPVPPPPLGRPDAPGPIVPTGAVAPAAPTPPPSSPAVFPSAPAGTATLGRPAPPAAPAESPPVGAAPAAVSARQLYQDAQAHYATIDSYIARLTRREQIGTKMNPEEVIRFSFRKVPWSVHFKWLGKEGAGRECIFVKGRYEGKLHTRLAAGDVFLMPAGKRMAFSPDSPLVRSASRHPITEAGIGSSIDRIGATLAALERGDRRLGTMNVIHGINRPELKGPVNGLELGLPPGVDPSLPRGGRRTYYFHPEEKLPMLICTTDERGKEVEYYHYDRLEHPVKLDDADFDPDRLWGAQRPAAAAARR
jgi:hypothetical protein